ncbi:SusC/RagA family TonB-linked outer membrane protein [Pedobacter sp. MC2016-14]|uniref:SusC/RagA family TonB-linked outer membrane protein n=1 Tax=Pedobacter sp. MC2016-14 TaxID=2897327 RepID=UPI001E2ACE30|nr:SusC/RagA family TonB-linked outer membrane protein [Pedobacter sp. MC2016-14]MCD0489191.1 SusC/RagA family TonB-linked outer membrane protein [Pedobacter sp. MC2016-14]
MYKFYSKKLGIVTCYINKLLLIMRLTTVLLIAGILQVSAASYAQKISLTEKNVPVQLIFKKIRTQSGYDFFFDRNLIKKANLVSINVKNADLADVLRICFEDSPLTYTIGEKTVVIKEREKTIIDKVAGYFASITVAGKVTDESGKAMVNVNVGVKNTRNSTTTNMTGSFILANVDEDAVLVFSSVGKETQEVRVKGRTKIEVTMHNRIISLDEVKVDNGYQIAKKGNLVGSTQTILAKELYLNGVNTLEQALQGKLAGVVVTNTSGLTGTKQRVRVRGTSTLSGTQEPIWVVDGIIQEDPIPFNAQTLNSNGDINSDNFDYIRTFVGNSIRWLNPMDIEDITVLKDASATAIYGIRAANGVIVITTKKGQLGPPAISYSTNFSTTEKVTYDKLNLMNSKERVGVSREIFSRGLTSSFVNSNIGYAGALNDYLYKKTITADEFNAKVSDLETANTDWFDLLFRVPISTGHNLSVSGGNGNTRYYSSFGYNNSKGTAIGNDVTGFTGNLSMTSQLSRKFNISARLSASQNKTNGFYIVDPYGYAKDVNRAIRAYTPTGELNFYPNKDGYLYNAINERNNTGNTNKVLSANASINANYQIIEGLNLQSLFSYNATATVGESYATEQSEYIARTYRSYNYGAYKAIDANYKQSKMPVGGQYNLDQNNSNAWSWRNSLSYNKVFNQKHAVSFMFGEEINSTQYTGYSNTSLGYLRDRGKSFAVLPVSTVTGTITTVNPLTTSLVPKVTDRLNNTMGLYLTSSYSYDSRYVFNMSVRNDRSNRFGQFTNEKFNPVWAGGAKWNIANEKWFTRSYWLSNLSLSGTFGYQRNIASNVSPDLIIKIPTGATSNNTDTYTGETLLTVSSLPYGDLRWEENSSMNLGLDFGLFNSKISGSFQYYSKRGRELITSLSVPSEYGVTSMLVNGGSMKNEGYEVTASFVPVRTKDFSWNVTLNTSKNTNTVTKIGPQVVSWGTAVSGTLNKVGMPVSSFYAFRFTGIDPVSGRPQIDLSVAAGADPKDPTSFMNYAGKMDPDFTSGLGMNFRYKMLTLNSSFYLQVGGKKFLSPLYTLTQNLPTEYQNLSRQLLDRWSTTNTTGSVPALPDSSIPKLLLPNGSGVGVDIYEMYNYSTDRLVSASALRCNNINLAYTLSESFVKRLKCKNINIGAGVSNPFAINSKDFKGLDAEVATGQQPRTRTYTINLNLSL